jgi:hypothetical protein
LGTLTFCCLSDKVAGELQELFRESFSLSLAPYAPWDSEKTDANLQGAAAVSGSRNLSLPSLPPGVDPLTVGREFLTWLWFKSEERNGMIRIPGGGESEVLFVRRLVLEAGECPLFPTQLIPYCPADLFHHVGLLDIGSSSQFLSLVHPISFGKTTDEDSLLLRVDL